VGLGHALLFAGQVEMIAPRGDRAADRWADALNRLEPPGARRKDRAGIAAEFLEQTIERDRTDIGQCIENQKRLPLSQLTAHPTNLPGAVSGRDPILH